MNAMVRTVCLDERAGRMHTRAVWPIARVNIIWEAESENERLKTFVVTPAAERVDEKPRTQVTS